LIKAKEKGYNKIIAGCDGCNEESLSFFKRFGFEYIGKMEGVGRKFHKNLDLIFLMLTIR